MDQNGQEDYKALALIDRLQHKIWKARISAYEELRDLFRKTTDSSDFHTYESHLTKMAADTNAVAQESALNTVYAYVDNAPNAVSTLANVVPTLVEKCLGAVKATTKQKASDIILLYIEIGGGDSVVELVLSGLNAKQPKLVTQTVNVLKESIRQFGTRIINPKPILKALPKLFSHIDKNVRLESSALAVELYRWLGAAIQPSLAELKPVQVKELEELFGKVSQEVAKPERLLRSQQNVELSAPDLQTSGQIYGQTDDMEQDPIDPFDLSDPVNILGKLPKNVLDLLESKSWKERREALDAVMASAKTPRIEESDYSELINGLVKRLNDSNILLVGAAATCIGLIAAGLRQGFSKYKSVVVPFMVDKLKERKTAILEQTANGLYEVFASVPISDIINDIASGTRHKNPQVRAECIKLLSRCLKGARASLTKPETKAIAECLLKTLGDADGNTRDASAECFGILMKLAGEKALSVYVESLDEIKRGKIRDAFTKAEVKTKMKTTQKPTHVLVSTMPPARITAPTASHLPTKAPVPMVKPRGVLQSIEPTRMEVDSEGLDVSSQRPPKRKPPSQLLGNSAKRPALSPLKPRAITSHTTSLSSLPKKAAKLPPPSSPEEIKFRFTAKDAEARVLEFIPDKIWSDLAQSQWKVRLEAMESLYNQFNESIPPNTEPEIVFLALSQKPGWKEMNFQVMTKMFGVMQTLAASPRFSKACIAISAQVLVEKLGDMKLKKPSGECLVTFVEKSSLQFVFSQAYPILKKAKSPKTMGDALTWMHSALMDFGVAGLQVHDLIDFIKFALSNTNPSVRTNAVTVLGALRLFIGPEVKSFVQDVSPALMAIIEAEFQRVADMEPPKPTRAPTLSSNAGGSNQMDALFPRVDISSLLNKAVAVCNDTNWKIRKEGLDNVLSIIEGANKRIKPNLGEFPGALKLRLNDSNKNLQIIAVNIAGQLAAACGKPFEKYLKLLTGPVAALLSDNKANVREASIAALESFRQSCGLDGMITSLASSLVPDSPFLRKELLSWLSTCLNQGARSLDLSSMVMPLFSCLQDRNAEVRKSAQMCLPAVIASVGYEFVVHKAADLKTAQRQAVMPLIEASKAAAANLEHEMSLIQTEEATRRDSLDKDAKAASARPKSLVRKKPGTATPRLSMVGASATQATTSQKTAPAPPQPPILTSDLRAKQIRAKKEIRWQFDSPRPDDIEALRALAESNMTGEICNMLFSTSPNAERDRLNGLTLLDTCIASPEVSKDTYGIDFSDMKKRFVANADIIFKYLTIRFFDTNTSIHIKCLDITQHLVSVLDEESYHLTEYEAISFLPFLINRLCDPKEVIRLRIRGILKAICRIYPASKLFNYLLDAAANSKNAKARAECLEEIGALIQRNGIFVMLPNKSLPLVAMHIGDRDAGVRNAALNAIAQAYILIGDAVFNHLSRLGEKEKGLLEERLKRTKPSASVLAEQEARAKQKQEMEAEAIPSINDLRLARALQHKRSDAQHTVSHRHVYEPTPMEDIQRSSDHARSTSVNEQRSHVGPSPEHQPRSVNQPSPQQVTVHERKDVTLNDLIAQISTGDPQLSVDALKQLDILLSTNPGIILPDVERLVGVLTRQLRYAYTTSSHPTSATHRLCKHLINALVLLFSNKELAAAAPKEALFHLLQELSYRLLDEKMLPKETGPQLSKALNVAMVKVLENGQRNATYSALLSILGMWASQLRPGDSLTATETRYTELTMKCLWKLAKTLQENVRAGTLNTSQLLYEINKFLITTPPEEWKRRASENVPLGEMPLRTVKTLLLELVNGLGEDIFQHLTQIENPQSSSVYPYLHHMLEAGRRREGKFKSTT